MSLLSQSKIQSRTAPLGKRGQIVGYASLTGKLPIFPRVMSAATLQFPPVRDPLR